MRARIIFRGLTLFTFEKPTEGATEGANLGTLTALLVSDPHHEGMGGLHEHKPLLGLIGRNRGKTSTTPGPIRTETGRPIPREMRIELPGHNAPAGVTVHQSFLDYVPRLGDLNRETPGPRREQFITRRIIIPSGTVRTREFIAWDWHGNTPIPVAYMNTNFVGFGANEVIVDIGDDSDIGNHDTNRYLSVTGHGVNDELWPITKRDEFHADTAVNTVELLITNLTARRRRPVFWGLHYQLLFNAAGFPDGTGYGNTPQFQAFERAALQYDPDEWQADSRLMKLEHPFPFLTDIDRQQDRLEGIHDPHTPYVLRAPPPEPPGRQRGEGVWKNSGHAHDIGTGHDPVNTEICPHGRE